MSTETPHGESPNPPPTIWQELRGAGMLTVAAIAVLLFIAYWLYVELGPLNFQKFGLFGDSFGALTSLFNALAFAALIATVVLQSRELRESRQELKKQAIAQQAWAEAAIKQIELTKQLEAIRIRPFIKMEWHGDPGRPRFHALRVRNVGLGVAVLRCIELRSRDQEFGTVFTSASKTAREQWERCIRIAIGGIEGEREVVTLRQFDDLNRALAPNEAQELLLARMPGDDTKMREQLEAMRKHLQIVIYFRAADGKELSTANQFTDFGGGDSA